MITIADKRGQGGGGGAKGGGVSLINMMEYHIGSSTYQSVFVLSAHPPSPLLDPYSQALQYWHCTPSPLVHTSEMVCVCVGGCGGEVGWGFWGERGFAVAVALTLS